MAFVLSFLIALLASHMMEFEGQKRTGFQKGNDTLSAFKDFKDMPFLKLGIFSEVFTAVEVVVETRTEVQPFLGQEDGISSLLSSVTAYFITIFSGNQKKNLCCLLNSGRRMKT